MKILTFILTKTGLLRWLGIIVAGLFVSWGVITEGPQKSQAAETITMLLIGAASLLIEKKKDNDARQIQEDVGAKPDGWAGPETRKAIEVRRAIPVRGNPKF